MEEIDRTRGVLPHGSSRVSVHGPVISGREIESWVTLVSLIGQDLTSGTGRDEKDPFSVISDIGFERETKTEDGGLLLDHEGDTGTYRTRLDRHSVYSCHLRQRVTERTQRKKRRGLTSRVPSCVL